ncbi:MAG: AsmA-like C-terminal region-containing protein [Chitinophagaceae bacterium]
MNERVIRVIKKSGKIIGVTIISLVLLLFLLPYLLPDTISEKIKKLVNKSIDGEVNFSKARLSFFNHFPALTLTLDEFTMKGAKPFQEDTLLSASEVAFGIDIFSLIRGNINVDQFFITEGGINVFVNEKGEANYNVYKFTGESTGSSSGGDTTAALKIESIVIEKSNLVYDDRSSDILVNAKGLNYSGKGDLSRAIFDLSSHIEIDSFDFYYDQQPYVLKKKVRADLITSVNTNSLALKFEKNKLRINRLPVEFTGKFDFLSKGYDMDFRLKSNDADLYEVFTVLPPSCLGWLKKTKIKGDANIIASLSGKYIAGTETMPDLQLDMKVRKGYIAYEKAGVPLSNLYIDIKSEMPGLNTDSLSLSIDSIFFNVENDHFHSVLRMKGYDAPQVFTRTSAVLDLQRLDQALGIQTCDLKGKLELQLSANGQYTKGQNSNRIRRDIVVTSIPSFSLKASLQNGFFRYASLPQPVQQVSFNLNADCPDNNYRHIGASIENIDIKALNNYIKGFIRLKNADNFPVDADLDAIIRLSDIQQFYPLDSMEINGNLMVKLKSRGNYQPAKKIFPKTEALLKVENASLRTTYYPAPIEKIGIDASVQNKEGTLYDLSIDVKPISFEFEGKPFMMKADFRNFDNIQYDIVSKGTIDLGKIYRVFSQDGWNVKGKIETDLSLKGNQADAAARRFSNLNNSGILKVNGLIINSDLYPLPFLIDRGVFRFRQDQMRFEEFRARYGTSTLKMNGEVFNVFNYVAGNGPLRGDIRLSADRILLDELMAYQSDSSSARPDSLTAGSSGVIMVPGDLDLKLTADIKNVDYNKLLIKNVKGNVTVSNGEIQMKETGFTLADAVTVMDATYKCLSPARALFTYHVTMNDFDVKKMYEQVELFRQLAPAAAKAQGVISLDYNLEGKLDGDMYPIMPSLKGGGALSLKKVKMKGFRLFSAMSKETGKSEINDPDLSKINFKTTIKNNVVTLDKTRIKVAGFRIRLQGQTSFDGKIKLKCRLGLPPLGIIGIPMNITGTGENPRVKVGKGDQLPLGEQKEEEEDIDN